MPRRPGLVGFDPTLATALEKAYEGFGHVPKPPLLMIAKFLKSEK